MRGRILTFLTIVAVLFVMPKRLLAQDRPAPIAEAVVGGSGFNRRGLGLLHHGWRRCPLVRHAATGNRARGSYLSAKFEASSLIITATSRSISSATTAGGPSCRIWQPAEAICDRRRWSGPGPGATALATFTSSEATASGGIGARIALGSDVFVAPEFRMGWEPETRIAVTIGIRPGP